MIETRRLIIDQIRKSDKEDYFINISSDREVLKTFICRYESSLEDFQFDRYLGRDDLYAIRLKSSGKLIGIFVECDVDREKKQLEIGYGLGSRYWNQGYMTEAVAAMLAYYLHTAGFDTVYASFFPENKASGAVMKKCGMTYSHTNEKELVYQDIERDLIYYRIRR